MQQLKIAPAILFICVALVLACANSTIDGVGPVHHHVEATVFWVGEPASAENAYIPNATSAWDGNWLQHYGGVDSPTNRQHQGEWPATFTPLENPFYVALPFNEFSADGQVKSNASRIFWYDDEHPPVSGSSSILKNRWVRITHGNKTAYAQWEDVGPYQEDDIDYVFGTVGPKDSRAGIDLSPAVAAYLGIQGRAKVSWQFAEDVPAGPWLRIVTTSQVHHP